MKKILLFVLTAVCLAGVFVLAKDTVMDQVKTFKDALGEVEQWKTLM